MQYTGVENKGSLTFDWDWDESLSAWAKTALTLFIFLTNAGIGFVILALILDNFRLQFQAKSILSR